MNAGDPVHRSSFLVHRSIVVLRLSALGDVIHTIPAVLTLRAESIRWVVEAPYRELVELVAGVEAVPVRFKREPREAIRAVRALRDVDATVDFQGLVKSAALGWLSRARIRYGFDRHAIREKPALLFTNRRVAVDTTKHVIEQNLQLASAVGAGDARAPRWDRFAADPDGKLNAYRGAIVLLPGAGRPDKLWPVERFRELANRLGERVVSAWGPGEEHLAQAIGARVAPPTNLRELAALLRDASVVIGGDTGPLHLAAALGTKTIGLFGPTNPRRNGPYGQLHRCVDQFGTGSTMESISVDEVMNRIQQAEAE